MQSLTFVGPHQLRWQERPAPALVEDSDALVRPVAASTCDIDRPIIEGRSPFEPPFAIGHEGIGVVTEIGDRVRSVRPGDLVVIPWHIACGSCDRCRRGLSAHCREVPAQAMFGLPVGQDWGGLFDDLVRVPYADGMLVRVPPAIDPLKVVSAGDNLTLGLEIMGPHLTKQPGARVLVLGAGAVGLYQVQIAKVVGAAEVCYVDDDEGRRKTAEGFGAQVYAGPPRSALGRFDLVVDAAYQPDWLRRAVRLVEPEGVFECIGGYFDDVALPLFAMYARGIRFRIGRSNLRPHIEPLLDLVAAGRLDPTVVHSELLPWDDAPAALADPSVKPVLSRL
jgi:alcohol dehydrogenase